MGFCIDLVFYIGIIIGPVAGFFICFFNFCKLKLRKTEAFECLKKFDLFTNLPKNNSERKASIKRGEK